MNHAPDDKIDASILTGVSETALMTLNGRAHQASLPDAIIDDPMAIRLVDSINFDFDKFGRKGQEMAVRSLAYDRCAIEYLTKHPQATVVALAEGLQTSFWRLSSALPDAQFRWLSIDLPPSSNCASNCCRHRRRSPTSRSPRWTAAGWMRWTAAMVCSSPLRA